MKKKKSSGGGANWMDTYGDMVTLLLCFFVLLYSMSTISEEAWKNLVMSFNPYAVDEGGLGGDGPDGDHNEQSGFIPEPEETDQDQVDDAIEQLFQMIQSFAGANDSVDASNDGGRIYLAFDGTTFFKGNSDSLTAEALPLLDSVAHMLSQAGWAIDEVRISGHTAQYSADQPNNPTTDWMLSSSRAARVCAYIQSITDSDILDPAKLAVEGRGQWHPRADNDTEEGKARNRRVEMVITGRDLETEMAGEIPSYSTDPEPSYSAEPTEPAAEPDTSGGPEPAA